MNSQNIIAILFLPTFVFGLVFLSLYNLAPKVIEVYVTLEPKRETLNDYPLLKRICACESLWDPTAEPRHFTDEGFVLTGRVNPLDTGMCQINARIHGAHALELGFDILTREGNEGFAIWLFKNKGTKPWMASASCWME